MLKKNLGTFTEVALIVLIAATAGIGWNRTLLTRAWHGEVTQQAEAAASTKAASAQAKADADPMPIGLQQVKEMLDAKQAVVIDARGADRFMEGHITGAILLPVDAARDPSNVTSTIKTPKDATLITYCNGFSCHDSMELGKLLIRAGYTSVYVYEGGFPEWRDAGYPVTMGGL